MDRGLLGRLLLRSTIVTALGFTLSGLAGVVPAGAAAKPPARLAADPSQTITSAGPLTKVQVTDDLNCAVNHTSDSSGEFYGDTACATLVAMGGTLYGPANIPAGSSASPRTTWTKVSQSPVTGSGTSAAPYTIVTVVSAGTTGVTITETDSYVVGQESYRTDVRISNASTSAKEMIIYRAGDCYLQDSDTGFGRVDTTTGAVACTTSQAANSRIEQWFPLSPGSRYYETYYDTGWEQIGNQQAFPNTCDCSTNEDNFAGLSWSVSVAAGASVTKSHFTTFSPLGLAPLSTSKTADTSTTTAGAQDGYTITVSNPNAASQTLTSIFDTLPSGFTYVASSTTGVTTSEPSVNGQTLTWSGSFSVPGAGSVSLHFNVHVSSIPGTYQNNAGGAGQGLTVAPTGDTAPILVLPAPSPTATPSPSPTTSPLPTPTPSATPTPSPTPSTPTLAQTGHRGPPGSLTLQGLLLAIGLALTLTGVAVGLATPWIRRSKGSRYSR